MDSRAIFLEEAETLFETLESTLLELEANLGSRELVDAAFRALHTLKGSGSMMGFDGMSGFAHVLEAAFDHVRSSKTEMSLELAELALQSVDVLKAHLEGPLLPPLRDQEAKLRQALETLGEPRGPETLRPEPEALRHYVVHLSLGREALRDGFDPLDLLSQVQALGEARTEVHFERLSLLDEFDVTECHLQWTIELSSTRELRDVESIAEPLFPGVVFEVQSPGGVTEDKAVPHVVAGRQASAESVPRPRTQPKRTTLKVDVEKLDQLLDLVGELVIARSRLARVAEISREPGLQSISEDVEHLTQKLRDQSMSLRMQPVGLLFKRYVRLVRDLGRQLGRDIDLVTEGDDTEIDKTVLDRLGDSLVHLIRNAADHGLEPAHVREQAGKPPRGTLRLRAYRGEGCVVVEVSDDGKGLDRDRILARALKRGLIGPDDERAQESVLDLIFEAGFSTAEKVSDVSGRGVGMDAVRRSIEELGGQIGLSSRPGEGTTFTIKIPLTLAIVDGLLVRIGHEPYVLPLDTVEECLEAPRGGEGASCHRVAEVRGEFVPYLSLKEWFGIEGPLGDAEQMVIANYDGHRFGFLVDTVVGQYQAVLKQMGPMTRVQGLSGSTILGDGTVALILDGASIMREVTSATHRN